MKTTDTQADLTERARDLTFAVIHALPFELKFWPPERVAAAIQKPLEAALQSEREAAAAEARRAALDDCATIAKGWASVLDGAGKTTALMIRDAIVKLASPPAPQEETR